MDYKSNIYTWHLQPKLLRSSKIFFLQKQGRHFVLIISIIGLLISLQILKHIR